MALLLAGTLAAGCGSRKETDARHHDQGLTYLNKTGEYAKAVQEFEAALRLNPKRLDSLYALGRAHLLLRQYDQSLKTFSRLGTQGDTRAARLGASEVHLTRAAQRRQGVAQRRQEWDQASILDEFPQIFEDLRAAVQFLDQLGSADMAVLLRGAEIATEESNSHDVREMVLHRQQQLDLDLNRQADAQRKGKQIDDEKDSSQQRLKDAAALYERVITLDNKQVVAYHRLIDAAARVGDAAWAERIAKRLLDLDPNSDFAHLALARIALSRGQAAEARAFAEKALAAGPARAEADLLMARSYLLEKNWDKVVEHTGRILAQDPTAPFALYCRGRALFEKRNYRATIESLQPLVRAGAVWPDPKQQALVYYFIAVAHEKMENPEQAITAYRQAIKTDPTNEAAFVDLLMMYLDMDRRDAALDLVRLPTRPALRTSLEALMCEKDAQKAWNEHRKEDHDALMSRAADLRDQAADLDPESPLARYRNVTRFLVPGRYDDCIQAADAVLAVDPANYAIRKRKVQALTYVGRPADALQTARDNLERAPTDEGTHLLITDVYLGYGRLDLALRYAERAAENIISLNLQRRLATLYVKSTDPPHSLDRKALNDALDSAARVAAKVLEKSPTDVRMRLTAAEALSRLGDTRAEAHLNSAVDISRKNPPVLQVAADYFMLRGDLARARELHLAAFAADPQDVASVYPLGMVLVAQGEPAEAVTRFRAALPRPLPLALKAKLTLGLVVALQAAGQDAEAAAEGARALGTLGASQAIETAHVMVLLGAAQNDQALAAVDAMKARHERAGAPLDPQAVKHLRELVASLKDDAPRAKRLALAANLATFHFVGGWTAQALTAAEKALAEAPQSVDRMVAQHRCLASAVNPAERPRALEVAAQIAKADPTWPAAEQGLAVEAERAGQFEVAEQAWLRAVALEPKDPVMRLHLGGCYEKIGNAAKALEAYRAGADIPDVEKLPIVAYQLYNNLAYCLAMNASDVPAAAKVAEKARLLAEKNAVVTRGPALHGSVLDTIGWIDYLSGKYAEAIHSLERANILRPLSAVLAYHLGKAYEKAGDKANARRWLKEAVDLSPERGFDEKLRQDAERTLKALAGPA